MAEEKKLSEAPIVRPQFNTPPKLGSASRTPVSPAPRSRKKPTKRSRYKQAKQTQRGAFNLRRLFAGLAVLLVLGLGFYFFTNPKVVTDFFNGKTFERTETCTVTRITTTEYFDTSCGKMKWDDMLEGSPQQNLTVGHTYEMHSSGITIPISSVYPRLVSYKAVS